MPSTEIISHNGEECSGKMKEVHDGGELVRFDALTPALSHRERGGRQPFRRIAMREKTVPLICGDWEKTAPNDSLSRGRGLG